MPPLQFVRWLPVYWVLTVIGQFISLLALAMGAMAGVLLFGLVWVALAVGFGFYSQSRPSKK